MPFLAIIQTICLCQCLFQYTQKMRWQVRIFSYRHFSVYSPSDFIVAPIAQTPIGNNAKSVEIMRLYVLTAGSICHSVTGTQQVVVVMFVIDFHACCAHCEWNTGSNPSTIYSVSMVSLGHNRANVSFRHRTPVDSSEIGVVSASDNRSISLIMINIAYIAPNVSTILKNIRKSFQ